MDQESNKTLIQLIRSQRIAALGTLRQGAPSVSMVLYAVASDLSAFYLHISRLAFHTQNILLDPRVGLMISSPDSTEVKDPQMLPRVSIQGEVRSIPEDSPAYSNAKSQYLSRFAEAQLNFALGDFSLYCIVPSTIRYVAGFGRIFNLTAADLKRAGNVQG